MSGLPVLWQVLRPLSTLLVLLHAVLGWLLVTAGAPPHPVHVVAAVGLIGTWYGHAAAVNDLSDVETDRINLVTDQQRSLRPLVNGSASVTRLWWVVAGLTLAQLGLAALINGWLLVAAVVMVGLNLAYSLPPIRLSARGGLAQLALPLGYVGYPAAIGVAVASRGGVTVEPAAVLTLAGLAILFGGRLFLKDVRDETGDRTTGKRTFLVRHGTRATVQACGAAVLAGLATSAVGLTMWLDRGSPVLVITMIGVAITIPLALRRVLVETVLDRQLLAIGLVGRIATTWLFCCLLLATARVAALPVWQGELLAGLGLATFALGCLRFAEELRRPATEGSDPAAVALTPHRG